MADHHDNKDHGKDNKKEHKKDNGKKESEGSELAQLGLLLYIVVRHGASILRALGITIDSIGNAWQLAKSYWNHDMVVYARRFLVLAMAWSVVHAAGTTLTGHSDWVNYKDQMLELLPGPETAEKLSRAYRLFSYWPMLVSTAAALVVGFIAAFRASGVQKMKRLRNQASAQSRSPLECLVAICIVLGLPMIVNSSTLVMGLKDANVASDNVAAWSFADVVVLLAIPRVIEFILLLGFYFIYLASGQVGSFVDFLKSMAILNWSYKDQRAETENAPVPPWAMAAFKTTQIMLLVVDMVIVPTWLAVTMPQADRLPKGAYPSSVYFVLVFGLGAVSGAGSYYSTRHQISTFTTRQLLARILQWSSIIFFFVTRVWPDLILVPAEVMGGRINVVGMVAIWTMLVILAGVLIRLGSERHHRIDDPSVRGFMRLAGWGIIFLIFVAQPAIRLASVSINRVNSGHPLTFHEVGRALYRHTFGAELSSANQTSPRPQSTADSPYIPPPVIPAPSRRTTAASASRPQQVAVNSGARSSNQAPCVLTSGTRLSVCQSNPPRSRR